MVLLVVGTPDLAMITGNPGGNYFGVIGYGDRSQLLVNTTDPYEGTVLVNSDVLALEIVSEGLWTIELTGTP
jgi:hypothetical protein